jgi:hypothetical protein
MRTIVLVEFQSEFPPTFSRKILKCLPENVAKLVIQPDNSIFLPKSTLLIYIGDKFEVS